MIPVDKGNTITVSGTGVTITPTHTFHHINGSGSIAQIDPPNPSFCGYAIFFIDFGSSLFANPGGINVLGGFNISVGTTNIIIWDEGNNTWIKIA